MVDLEHAVVLVAVDGMQKNRAIVASGRARLLALLTRLLPSAADQALAHSMTKELQRSGIVAR